MRITTIPRFCIPTLVGCAILLGGCASTRSINIQSEAEVARFARSVSGRKATVATADGTEYRVDGLHVRADSAFFTISWERTKGARGPNGGWKRVAERTEHVPLEDLSTFRTLRHGKGALLGAVYSFASLMGLGIATRNPGLAALGLTFGPLLGALVGGVSGYNQNFRLANGSVIMPPGIGTNEKIE